MTQAASALYEKVWGKPWPSSEGEITEADIKDDKTHSADDENGYLADKLRVDLPFHYWYFKEIDRLKGVLRERPEEEPLVVREEYKALSRHWRLNTKTLGPS